MDTPTPQNLSIPYFLLQSHIEFNTKVHVGNLEMLGVEPDYLL